MQSKHSDPKQLVAGQRKGTPGATVPGPYLLKLVRIRGEQQRLPSKYSLVEFIGQEIRVRLVPKLAEIRLILPAKFRRSVGRERDKQAPRLDAFGRLGNHLLDRGNMLQHVRGKKSV